MDRKPEVLIIPAWFSHKNPNEGIFIHEFCEAMQRNGINVTLLYIQYYSLKKLLSYFTAIKFNINHSYNILTVKHLSLVPVKLKRNFVADYKKSVYENVYNKLKNIHFDCIHFQSLCNNLTPYIGIMLAKKINCKYIVTEHYTSYEQAGNKIFEPYLDKEFIISVLKGSAKNIAVSQFAAGLYQRYFGVQFFTIPNIIALDFFKEPFKPVPENKSFTFCFIGALEERKGILELLRVFLKLSLVYDIKLHVIGHGSQAEFIQAFVINHKLEKMVLLLGRKSVKEIIKILDSSHATISASNIETFGLVILESHLRGRPVIAVNSGAVIELMNKQNGIVCNKTEKEKNLEVAMEEMMTNYITFDPQTIRRKAMMAFGEKTIINQYKNSYL